MKTKWFIAYKKRGPNVFDVSGLKRFETPKGQYEADPFLFNHKGKDYVFYELFDYKKGVIAYSTLTERGMSKPKVCLEEPFHLSYPCVITGKDGGIYMIPEMTLASRIDIYKAVKFPDKWEKVHTILDGYQTEDNNVFLYNGLWWMITSQGNINVLVMSSKSLLGKWEPVTTKQEVNCRNAGQVFEYQGKLLRPTQESHQIYGRALLFRETQLPDYGSEVIARIEPDWYEGIEGTHTFNFNEDWVALDGKLRI